MVSDDIAKYDPIRAKFPAGTEFHDRAELDAVQRRLREMAGVTILIYEQTCAAEKRRRRKKGELVDPARRLFINERVCEGCGDCSVQSNCVAVVPLETELGRKRSDRPVELQQGLLVREGLLSELRRRRRRPAEEAPRRARRRGRGALRRARRRAAAACAARLDRAVRPARHRRRRHRRRHRRRADRDGRASRGALGERARLHGLCAEGRLGALVRPPRQGQGGAQPGAHRRAAGRRRARLRRRRRRVGRCPADGAARPHARAREPARDSGRRVDLESRRRAAASTRCSTRSRLRRGPSASRRWTRSVSPRTSSATRSSPTSLAMGYAWQRGLVPVGLAAMLRAIELNGVAVDANKAAFSLGRLAAADPAAARELLHEPDPARAHAETLDELIDRSARFLDRLPERCLRRSLSPQGRARARARKCARRRRRGAAADARGRRAAVKAHGLQGRVRGRAASTATASSRSSSRSSSRATCDSSSTWRRRRS